MQTITVECVVQASLERCFDAARDLDLHIRSLSHTGEIAVAGRTSGLIEMGEVKWRARHFGVTQHFTSRITAYDRPYHFQDTMHRGAFKSFVHDHFFTRDGESTRMTDVLVFTAPYGILGRVAGALVLRGYLLKLLTDRAVTIKESAEQAGTHTSG